MVALGCACILCSGPCACQQQLLQLPSVYLHLGGSITCYLIMYCSTAFVGRWWQLLQLAGAAAGMAMHAFGPSAINAWSNCQ